LPASTFDDSTGPACTNAILGCGGECAPCPCTWGRRKC
jgi:hypothetical protein